MEIDKNRLVTVLIDKTNQKVSELQQSVLMLESQLQLAVELNEGLKKQLLELDKIKKKDKSDFQN